MLSHLLDSSLLPLALPAWPAVTRARAAPLDIEDHKDNYLLLVDVPGFHHQDIHLELHGRQLVIQASRNTAGSATASTAAASVAGGQPQAAAGAGGASSRTFAAHLGGVVLYQERPRASTVRRVVHLPPDVLLDKIAASLEDGVLMVTMPKERAVSTRNQKTIQVSKL